MKEKYSDHLKVVIVIEIRVTSDEACEYFRHDEPVIVLVDIL